MPAGDDIEVNVYERLPRLGWVYEWRSGVSRVILGTGVEQHPTFFVEGAWDGDFIHGRFDESEHFFGSGLRVDDRGVHFIPSSGLTDRLICCQGESFLIVSNSLSLLLARTGDRLDPTHDYRTESSGLTQGIKRYRRDFEIPSIHGYRYFQLIYECMTFSNGALQYWTRPASSPIRSFSDYKARLEASLDRLRLNATDPRRVHRMTAVTTLSSGYDSAAVASLARRIGVTQCFTSRRSNSALPWRSSDDGTPIADALGLQCLELSPAPPPAHYDLLFAAGNPVATESVFHSLATYIERSGDITLVLTGYHGDKVWDVNLDAAYATDEILRGDSSGLGLSAARLHAGFINVPVPFMFARRVADMVGISRSDEMRAWRLQTDYDRPIARRIAEEAGVRRGAFARRKKAVWRGVALPRQKHARETILRHIEKRTGLTPRRVAFQDLIRRLRSIGNTASWRIKRHIPSFPALPVETVNQTVSVNSLTFVAAVEILAEKYRATILDR